MLISFYGSRSYAFKHRQATGPGGGLVNYAIINFASFVIPMACLWVTRNVFDWDTVIADNVAANVVGAVLAMLVRFWAFRRFVFKRHAVEFHGEKGTLVFGSAQPGSTLQNSVHTKPSSSSISRSSGRLIPTTLCGSPVTPETKAPAEAVEGEGAGDR